MDAPHEVLDVDPDADERAIQRAYRERVKRAHPDHGGSSEEFQRVKAAYEALTANGDRAPSVLDESDDGTGAAGNGSGSEPDARRVEYLNYEALDDHGWEIGDDDLFEKASAAGLSSTDYGRLLVQPNETLLEAAENRGFAWPYACRGGACANCAIIVRRGDLTTPVNHVLPDEMVDRGVRLSCVGRPTVDGTRVVFNVKHLPELDELRLPPSPFESARADD